MIMPDYRLKYTGAEIEERLDKVDELQDSKTIVSNEEPTEGTLWIKPEGSKEIILAEIDDAEVSDEKTWSSNKIENQISNEIEEHKNDEVHITSAERVSWNAKSNFSGNYNDLNNKPTIPSKTSQLTNDSGYITKAPVEVAVQSGTPSEGMLWVDIDEDEEVILAEIDDNVIDTEKTWSSSKINEEVSGLNEKLVQLEDVLDYGIKLINVFDSSENTVDTALDKSLILSSGAIRNNGNVSDKSYFVTGKLSVQPNVKYTVKPFIWLEALAEINRGRCYSSNDVALEALTWETDQNGNVTFVAPENSAYVRFSVRKEKIGEADGSEFTDVIAEFNNIFSLNIEEGTTDLDKSFPVKNEIILNFGDSIFGKSRPPYDISTIIQESSKATVKNVAFGGCRMSKHVGNWDAFSMYRLADSIANNDWSMQDNALNYSDRTSYAEEPLALLKDTNFSQVNKITIAYGTNDFGGSCVLDNEGNLYDTTTFGGALRHSIETILSAFPNIDIILLTPTYRFFMDDNNNFINDSNTEQNSNGDVLIDFVDKMKEIGKQYNLHVVDMYNLGINEFNHSYYFPKTDGTHHNANGRKLIAKKLIHELY